MSDTMRLSAEEIARALTKLLIGFHEQDAEQQAAAHDDEANTSAPGQIALPLQNSIDADGAQQGSMNQSGQTGAPWEILDGVVPKGLNLPMSPALYAKMLWITNNVPKMSLQKIARMGAEMAADKLIAEHYKPDATSR